jgi:hypothetical protein
MGWEPPSEADRRSREEEHKRWDEEQRSWKEVIAARDAEERRMREQEVKEERQKQAKARADWEATPEGKRAIELQNARAWQREKATSREEQERQRQQREKEDRLLEEYRKFKQEKSSSTE